MTPGHERLSGAWNFRDVAETAGLRPGRLFRSSELSKLDEVGRQTLAGLGITDVADLRSPAELERRGGGAVPGNVAVHNLPFPEVAHSHDGDGEAPLELQTPQRSAQRFELAFAPDHPRLDALDAAAAAARCARTSTTSTAGWPTCGAMSMRGGRWSRA